MAFLVSRDHDQRWHFQLSNELTALSDLEEQVGACLDQADAPAPLPEATRAAILLVFDEMITNVIKYAFPEGGRHQIEAWLSLEPRGGFEIELIDEGTPFDPTGGPPSPPPVGAADAEGTAALESRPLGGWGLHLVRRSVDRIDYQRDGRRNRVVLRKAAPVP